MVERHMYAPQDTYLCILINSLDKRNKMNNVINHKIVHDTIKT